VAIAAINPVVAGVVLVAKLNGLLALDKSSGRPGRTVDSRDHPERAENYKDGSEDGEPG
jgi:hypothetical protein